MRSLYFILTLIIFPIVISSSANHEYYVSVTEVEYVEEQQSLQIISQIFIDDFETLLRKRYNENLTLHPDSDAKVIENYMKRYLADKLKIKVNGNDVNFNFIGKEYKQDITYCYLEIKNISNIKSIEVINSLLFDVLPEQQNIVRLKIFERNKSFLLLPNNDKCMLNFN
ncbi:DUF6702 family protein [Winogradskyella bathintestinalis]|uniref:Peptidase E n=1 Tax=Winogradskyella bathintestinalis TaxID=3035208 RepID=A0ABT7ZV84_9FLAO|nr:DUF6702 family protein [Winogradskyella bathintestinalis]MDN3492906.1 peptidase E [Winogradskyella bathintestinalis]